MMNIIYLSSSCSDNKFSELRDKGITRKLPQAQKYHCLLMEGIAQNVDGIVYAISAFPVNRQWTKQVLFPEEREMVGAIQYIYGAFVNLPFLRQWTRILQTQREIKRIHHQNHDCIIICDVLNQSLADAARACGKRYGIPVVGIVTDVPGHTSGARSKTYSSMRRMMGPMAAKNAVRNLAWIIISSATRQKNSNSSTNPV